MLERGKEEVSGVPYVSPTPSKLCKSTSSSSGSSSPRANNLTRSVYIYSSAETGAANLKTSCRTLKCVCRAKSSISGRKGRTASGWARFVTSRLTTEEWFWSEHEEEGRDRRTVIVLELVVNPVVDMLLLVRLDSLQDRDGRHAPNIGGVYTPGRNQSASSYQRIPVSPRPGLR